MNINKEDQKIPLTFQSALQLSNDIFQTNSIQSYRKLQSHLKDIQNVMNIIQYINIQFQNGLRYESGQYIVILQQRQQILLNKILFVNSEIISKLLLRYDLYLISQTRSQQLQNNQDQQYKTKQYKRIINSLINILQIINQYYIIEQYIVKSICNLISICLKNIFQITNNNEIFHQILNQWFPQFNFSILSMTQNKPYLPIHHLPPCYKFYILIIISLFDYMNVSAYYKSYYIYRKNIYNVRNYYLPVLLNWNLAIIKGLMIYPTQSQNYIFISPNTLYSQLQQSKSINSNPQTMRIRNIGLATKILELLTHYQFTMSLHEYENDQMPNGDSYFPSFFNNLLLDYNLHEAYIIILKQIMQCYCIQIKNKNWNANYQQNQIIAQKIIIPQISTAIIKILSKIWCTSNYIFNSQEEREHFRKNALKNIIQINNIYTQLVQLITIIYKNTSIHINDNYSLQSISQLLLPSDNLTIILKIHIRVMNLYRKSQLMDHIESYLKSIYNLIHQLPLITDIKIQNGKNNILTLLFDLLQIIHLQSENQSYENQIKNISQQILQLLFVVFCNNQYCKLFLLKFNNNIQYNSEVECFQQLYQSIPKIFKINLDKNLNILANIELTQLGQYSLIFWLHLASILLPSHSATKFQTQIILKYFYIAQKGNNIASLHYVNTTILQILFQLQNGISSTSLWKFINDIQQVNFDTFIIKSIQLCMKNLIGHPSQKLIDYSLEMIKGIYIKLKKSEKIAQLDNNQWDCYRYEQFNSFYNKIKQLLQNINNTILSQLKYYKKRVQLFKIISIIWINNGYNNYRGQYSNFNKRNYQHIYQIYQLIIHELKNQNNIIILIRYLIDCKGLIQPIENYQTFSILTQLIIHDLNVYLPHIIGSPNLNEINCNSNHQIIQLLISTKSIKPLINLILTLTNDYSKRLTFMCHTDIPYKLHSLFYPYLYLILTYVDIQHIPTNTIELICKFIDLNPLEPLLPLNKKLKQKKSSNYNQLIRDYFDKIHRVNKQELISMYQYIEDNLQYLDQWTNQIINRKLYPSINVRSIIDAKIDHSKKQKQHMAKIVYNLGMYHPSYWNLGKYQSHFNQFVHDFCKNIQ